MLQAAAATEPPSGRQDQTGTNSKTAPTTSAAAVPAVAKAPPDLGLPARELSNFVPAGWSAGELVVEALPAAAFGAEQTLLALHEYHSVGVASRTFQRGQRRVMANIYRFESPQGAYGAYTFLRRGATTVVTLGDASSEDDHSLSFWRNDYFIYVSTSAEDDEEAKEMMRLLAKQLAGAIETRAALPAVIQYLPQLDRIGGSERLIMGPAAVRRMLAIPYAGVFEIEHARAAACADYQFLAPRPERMKLLIIDYGDPTSALVAYRRYCSSLEDGHEPLESGETSLFKLKGSYLYCLPKGKFVIVISGARSVHSSMVLARQMSLPAAPVDQPPANVAPGNVAAPK